MTTIYTTDSMGVFAGVQDVDAYAPMPPRSTLTPPPAVVGAQVARLTAGAWEVLPAYPEPPAPSVPVPASVTMRQARLALLGAGLLDDVEAVITAAGRAAQLEWEYAAVVERTNPAVAAVQQQQGLTDAQIDDLFREAAKL